MPGDPQELRRRALQCSKMAQRAMNKRELQTLIRLQRSYVRLAVEVEKAQALFATSKANELGDERDALTRTDDNSSHPDNRSAVSHYPNAHRLSTNKPERR